MAHASSNSNQSENRSAATGSEAAHREEQILEFWRKERVFERSLEQTKDGEEFVFYDGPPFATGLPHYGHLLAGTIKDVVPRYQTMRGRFVSRQWGWDCHGLPVENEIEKELDLNTRKEIETYGIDKFNQHAREAVLRYAGEWRRIVPRLGRFVDMDNDYRTMDPAYTESVWWAFKTLYERGLIYKSFKSMHLCPRCETTLSNFEVNQGYSDIKDFSVTAEFELLDQPDTYLLAWTTTAWTLPGNVALAVGANLEYVKVVVTDENGQIKNYILAADTVDSVMVDRSYQELERLTGSELVGLKYQPLFDYYTKAEGLENRDNGWQIYPAEFVTTEEGTGIVHIAPAFGQDDFQLSQAHQLPFIQHVDRQGKFKPEVKDLAGRPVKPKDDPTAADVEIIKLLAGQNRLFAKEKITHSYPHCWRCDTPLLNYATDSWFVKVTDLKAKLIAENEKIGWVPEHVGDSRFGKWLEEVRDWAISRSRYWGAPLPVWRCSDCGEQKVAGSVEDIFQPGRNTYWVMRHGLAQNNVDDVLSADPKHPHHLTDQGLDQVKRSAASFSGQPDLIIASDFVRTAETAKQAAAAWGLSEQDIVWDARLREFNFGDLHLQPVKKYHAYYTDCRDGFNRRLPNGESYRDVKRRVGQLLLELEEQYQGRKIVLVTHHTPAWLIMAAAGGLSERQTVDFRGTEEIFFDNAEIRQLDYKKLPRNTDYETDLHRPFIDGVEFKCNCGGRMQRVEEVFDCWFESGSMPFASNHYPFTKDRFDPDSGLGFPAGFIAEGLDQTRGWFYTMLVLSVGLFGRTSYRNVIVNGIVLAADGSKMAKRKKNYPDPLDIADRYGADPLRYTLLSSPVVRGEDLAFQEKAVDEAAKKIMGRLINVTSFLDLYGDCRLAFDDQSDHVLDRWMINRTARAAEVMTKHLDQYRLDKATRQIGQLVDDLSVWYLRRSRDRIKAGGPDGAKALSTLGWTLRRIALLAAPFIPFTADYVYRTIKNYSSDQDWQDSVHLDRWPSLKVEDEQILTDMAEVRQLISEALELRAEAGIKVRQPLSQLTLQESMDGQYLEIIKDEVNIKTVTIDPQQTERVQLDIEVTPELQKEGDLRELLRAVQSLRKKYDLLPTQPAELYYSADQQLEELLQFAKPELKQTAKIESMVGKSDLPTGEKIRLSEGEVIIDLKIK